MKRFSWAAGCALAALMFTSQAAEAQRSERLNRAVLSVNETCPVTSTQIVNEVRGTQTRESIFGPILGTLLASVIGDIAGAGIKAIGSALDAASQERGFVADGTSGFYMQRVAVQGGAVDLSQRPLCLSLYLPSADQNSRFQDIVNDPAFQAFTALDAGRRPQVTASMEADEIDDALKPLLDLGATRLPAIYVEAIVVPLREGVAIQPVFAWYRERMPGAPNRVTPAELHVTLATPANTAANPLEIGTTFAVARMQLPDLGPGGRVLGIRDLRSSRSVIVPGRASSPGVEAQVTRYAGTLTAVTTRRAELRAADRAFAAATRKLAAADTADNREALVVATEIRDAAKAALAAAESASADLRPIAVEVGPVNARMRFVAVRERDAILQAVARILTARAEEADTAITQRLTSELAGSDWTAGRTAYIEAMQRVAAKERELDAARPANDSAVLNRLSDELTIAKAKANEAAVAARVPLPYPSLTFLSP